VLDCEKCWCVVGVGSGPFVVEKRGVITSTFGSTNSKWSFYSRSHHCVRKKVFLNLGASSGTVNKIKTGNWNNAFR
jgi:hypothetical protein